VVTSKMCDRNQMCDETCPEFLECSTDFREYPHDIDEENIDNDEGNIPSWW